MTPPLDPQRCDQAELVCAYALRVLPARDVPAVEAHLLTCAECRRDLVTLRTIVDSFSEWETDALRPSAFLWERLADRIAAETGEAPAPQAHQQWAEPPWEPVAPGILCKLLATDVERSRVSMLVRLEPGTEYPPHTHAGVEELHLLDGELWINDRKLLPGDYNRAEPGTSDRKVWSETGCTCLLITSPADVISG